MMEERIARILNDLNRRFYDELCASFSATRERPWDGWRPVADSLESGLERTEGRACVLDLGCGNMRFEAFLEDEFPDATFEFECLDASDGMAHSKENARFTHCDIVESLLDESPLPAVIGGYDMVVAFGLLHHIPGNANRELLVRHMVDHARVGGLVALSFWEYAEVGRLAKKSEKATEEALATLGIGAADLEPGDGFLGWGETKGIYRYCHSFTEKEIDGLIAAIGNNVRVLKRYKADTANVYAVLERKA